MKDTYWPNWGSLVLPGLKSFNRQSKAVTTEHHAKPNKKKEQEGLETNSTKRECSAFKKFKYS